MKLVRKINAKSVVGSPATVVKLASDDGEPVMLVWGRATGVSVRHDMDRNGEPQEYFFLTGDFRARNVETSEEYAAPTLSLPEYCMLPARGALEGEASMVELAFEVLAVESDDSPVGFRLDVRPLIEDQQEDPLRSLEQKAMKALEKV